VFVSPDGSSETILLSDEFPKKPFSASTQNSGNGASLRIGPIKTAGSAANTGDSQMRSLSFFLALAFVLGGPTLAGTSDGGLPGIGTFGYQASPTLIAASALVVAAR
jgi:hypothetical protein